MNIIIIKFYVILSFCNCHFTTGSIGVGLLLMSVTIEHSGGVLSKGTMIGAMATAVVAMGEAASCLVPTALEHGCELNMACMASMMEGVAIVGSSSDILMWVVIIIVKLTFSSTHSLNVCANIYSIFQSYVGLC